MKRKRLEIQYPLGGINRSLSYRNQPPYTCYDAQNARGRDSYESRLRGGQRSGLVKAYSEELGSGAEIRMLAQISTADDTAYSASVDNFDRTATGLGDGWTAASWLDSAPNTTEALGATLSSDDAVGAVKTSTGLNVASEYHIKIYIVPYEGEHRGKYHVYARMNDTTPVATTDGIDAWLDINGATGIFTGSLDMYVAGTKTSYAFTGGTDGSALPGWLDVKVATNTVTCYWRGTQQVSQAITAQTGTKTGFGMEPDSDGDTCLVSSFAAQGTPTTSTVALKRRTRLLAISAGQLYMENTPATMTAVSGATVTTGQPIFGVEHLQKFYIADYNVAGNGVLKILDPTDGSWATVTASAGTVPVNCIYVCRYRDRLVLFDGYLWYMSASGDPTDWDYSTTVATGAVSGQEAIAGTIGEIHTAAIPWGDDYMILASQNAIYNMVGDPKSGGEIVNISRNTGIVGWSAWCWGEHGELYFLGNNGLFRLIPGGLPEPMSREKLPRDLINVSSQDSEISLVYNPVEDGVHIYKTRKDGLKTTHWFYSLKTGGFWQDSMDSDHEPYCAHNYTTDVNGMSKMLIGCDDGYIRNYDEDAETDDGENIDSYVKFAPIRLVGGDYREGVLNELIGVMAQASGDIAYEVMVANTNEEAVVADSFATGTWTGGGLQASDRTQARGGSMVLKVGSDGARSWSLEKIIAIAHERGRLRLI